MSHSMASSSSPEQHVDDRPTTSSKRKESADKEGDKASVNASGRQVKRRASKACQSCRQRKVRCNVVEHGAPCTNCRLDQVSCVVAESKRRKKQHPSTLSALSKPLDSVHEHLQSQDVVPTTQQQLNDIPPRSSFPHVFPLSGAEALRHGSINPLDLQNSTSGPESFSNEEFHRHSESSESMDEDDMHVPQTLYASQQQIEFHPPSILQTMSMVQPPPAQLQHDPHLLHESLLNSASMTGHLRATRLRSTPPPPRPSISTLPSFIKPLPPRMASEDIEYLSKKGALTIPATEFRNELLKCFVEFVYPYMPLIDLQDFLKIVNQGTGRDGKISLILFHAVLFTGTAFVDMRFLREAGFATRKAARKAFYNRTRLLYDFDYELDRLALIQSLLLMTYWYETPDDQKDTWHWMGVAISLAHTLGLHRDPEKTIVDVGRRKLWKRIWWSCFMRDRLVALGMRRPTRIKEEDYDVPMLTMDDFEIAVLPQDNTIIAADCVLIRNLDMQRDLAFLCIAKAKLTICISHILSSQYSVLVRDHGIVSGDSNTRSSIMLIPKKVDQIGEVRKCGQELLDWKEALPERYRHTTPTPADIEGGRATMVVQKALLQMIYWATVSALHRPQVLPAEPISREKLVELRDESRQHVKNASRFITDTAYDLHVVKLERYLPTTGVTVLLPAIIIHLLDIKSNVAPVREAALQGFCNCMLVLEQLRENYAAADYATQFLEAAIKKADIDVGMDAENDRAGMVGPGEGLGLKTLPPTRVAHNVSQLLDSHRAQADAATPPPDPSNTVHVEANGDTVQNAFTPPVSESSKGMAENDPAIVRNALAESFSLSIPTSRKSSFGNSSAYHHHHQNLPMTDDLIDWSNCEPSCSVLSNGTALATPAEAPAFEWDANGNFESMQVMDAHGETGGFGFGDIVDDTWMNEGGTDWSKPWPNDAMDVPMSFAK